jgi:phospholipase D1/2
LAPQEAYVSIIQHAKHYVYIENQYFISATPNLASPDEPTIDDAPNGTYPSSDTPVIARNRIAWALYLRISDAIRTNTTFRAIIICPLMPDMHGDVATNVALRAVVHNELHTIRWLFNSLKAAHPTAIIDHYLSVHCLHQFQVLPSGAVLHGEIYVHAKTMIADDRTIVVGSANINDRSMRGTRDSETVLVIEDHSYVKSMMNGKPYKAGANAHRLRLRLWLEHLGHIGGKCSGGRHNEGETPWNHTDLSMDVVQALYDPVHDNTYLHIWKHMSSINTIAYARAFPSYPSNEIRTLTELQERLRDAEEGTTKDESKRKEIAETLRAVQGHLVDYPVDFLVDSDLSPPLTAPESLLPSYVFV